MKGIIYGCLAKKNSRTIMRLFGVVLWCFPCRAPSSHLWLQEVVACTADAPSNHSNRLVRPVNYIGGDFVSWVNFGINLFPLTNSDSLDLAEEVFDDPMVRRVGKHRSFCKDGTLMRLVGVDVLFSSVRCLKCFLPLASCDIRMKDNEDDAMLVFFTILELLRHAIWLFISERVFLVKLTI